MEEILQLDTAEWTLFVWSKNISSRQQILKSTLDKRPHHSEVSNQTLLYFSSPCQGSYKVMNGEMHPFSQTRTLCIANALFFENLQYHFEWVFKNSLHVESAELTHKLARINNSFRFTRRHDAILQGIINTGNDIGLLSLPLKYKYNNQISRFSLTVNVLPIKMDLDHDINEMYRLIDQELPLWRFSSSSKTEQTTDKSKQRGHFELLWLARFQYLRDELCKGLRLITHSPHHRLLPEKKSLKADRIRGRLTSSLAEKIKLDMINGRNDKHYTVTLKKLSFDTPENRFIKYAVRYTVKSLERIKKKIEENQLRSDTPQFSKAFVELLASWQSPLQQFHQQHFLNDVSEFASVHSLSLVLQQKSGYATIYHIWQELKHYLDILGNHDTVPMKSIAEIYETWCFLEIRRILIDELGFREILKTKSSLSIGLLGERQFSDGLHAAFNFERADGVHLRLAHEPSFSESTKPIRSWKVTQRPDILLEANFQTDQNTSKNKVIWLFDAKYRIKSNESEGLNSQQDLVPDDAINQMHRYRDALIYEHNGNSYTDVSSPTITSRPVLGAFALYPGYFDQLIETNPYQEQIDAMGIGAFALLPSTSHQYKQGNCWLSEFLSSQLGKPTQGTSNPSLLNPELKNIYLQNPIRIANLGMKQLRYPDLIMTVGLGDQSIRTTRYMDSFFNGTACWYHIPQKTFNQKYAEHLIREIAFLAIGSFTLQTANANTHKEYELCINNIWQIKSTRLLPRNQINAIQAGYEKPNSEELYWLFELHKAIKLPQAVIGTNIQSFMQSMKFTQISSLISEYNFNNLTDVYDQAWAKHSV